MPPSQGSMGPPLGQQGHSGQMNGIPHGQATVFGNVMGPAPGQPQVSAQTPQTPVGAAKVYASVYMGIPVFEAMIRGISVMRRTVDSWVNATQILKVAGIPKSARTKILETQLVTGVHEKVQGGYGKYQGTWVPFQRGQELAAQYGVTAYLAPIFDFIPSPSNVAALPIARHQTPDRASKTPVTALPAFTHQMLSSGAPGSAGPGRIMSPFPHGNLAMPSAEYVNGDMGLPPHPSAFAYPGQQTIYYQGRPLGMAMTPSRSGDGVALAPPADINGMTLPPSGSNVYIDQYGQTHPTFQVPYQSNGDMQPPPAKRQRSDEGEFQINGGVEEQAEEDVGDDEESMDELRDAPPLPTAMRLADKPSRPRANANASRTRSKLLSLFSADEPVDVRSAFGLTIDAVVDIDIDMIIDNQGHTALHWACSLAKQSVTSQLIELGADIHRGNYAGETPLIRSVLASNHAEAGTFPALLDVLSPSIRTLDHAYRTVVHHIALVAGVRGRAASARVYLAAVLEWVAREQQSAGTAAGQESGVIALSVSLTNLVDVQDLHGDTALNVAARVGNKGLVNLLLDAGADKARANNLGLRPADFGLEVDALQVSPAEAVVANLKAEVPKPERQSRDVQKNISAIFETINDSFASEMMAKQTKLNSTEASVRHATRALADKRQQVQRIQRAFGEQEQLRQKIENIHRALGLVGTQDWTGRIPLSSELISPPAFHPLPPLSQRLFVADELKVEIPMPERGEEDALLKLRRLSLWEDRIAELLEDRTKASEGESADKAVKYRRLVSLCTKVPADQVDSMLDGLTSAIESEEQGLDLSRISNFVSRMKGQPA